MTAHESVLYKSTTLSAEVVKAKANARKSKPSTITLLPYNKAAFEQILAFLYTDKLNLAQYKLASNGMKEVREAISLAKHYNLEIPANLYKTFERQRPGSRILCQELSATFDAYRFQSFSLSKLVLV